MNRALRCALALALLIALLMSSALAGYATLSYGDSGSSVLALQQALTRLGYNAGTLDGKYGAFTQVAVRSFQRDHSLKVDGVAGNQTQALLYQLASGVSAVTQAPTTVTKAPTKTLAPNAVISTPRPTRTLRRGDTGADVSSLQLRLGVLGYYAGTISGTFDTATYAAVTTFQIVNGLTADGVAGSSTYNKLYSNNASPYPGISTVTAKPVATAVPTATVASFGTVPTRTLRQGSSGSDVLSLQQRLQALGYYTDSLSGSFDSVTKIALTGFQLTNGLTADGVAGSLTYARLYSVNAIAAPKAATPVPTQRPAATPTPVAYVIPTRTLRLNMTGADVTSVQQRLRELGYLANVSGVYDAATKAAVLLFQQRNGLSADGLAGSVTCARLFSGSALPAMQPVATPTAVPTAAPTPVLTAVPTTIVTANPSSGIPTRTLRKGSTGDDVRQLQIRLMALGYFTTTITGEYNSSTVDAVKAFQQRNGLTADGVAGSLTCARLFSTSAIMAALNQQQTVTTATPAATPQYRTLTNGSTGNDVLSLQQRLRDLGYTVTVTGSFDSATVAAVKQFQTNNYLSVDGIAGPETQRTLYSTNAAKASETPNTSYTSLSVNTADNTTALVNMQKRLVELGYLKKSNGKYDGDTHNAVVAFQQRNGIMISGIANGATQAKMYSASALPYSTPVETLPEGTGRISTPSGVKALWWYNDVKPTIKAGNTVVVFDPNTNLSWNIKLYSLGHHADSQPATWQDTQIMNRSFGKTSWDCKPVYVKLPNGTWVIAAMHNYPHLYGTISDNGFGGHLCIHFLRDINECISAGDSNYGVSMQNAIRTHWKALTGETIE